MAFTVNGDYSRSVLETIVASVPLIMQDDVRAMLRNAYEEQYVHGSKAARWLAECEAQDRLAGDAGDAAFWDRYRKSVG